MSTWLHGLFGHGNKGAMGLYETLSSSQLTTIGAKPAVFTGCRRLLSVCLCADFIALMVFLGRFGCSDYTTFFPTAGDD